MTETAPEYVVSRPAGRHGCWRDAPLHHPWLPIPDVACGFDGRLVSPKCVGCHRSRAESPMCQLDALGGRGDVARVQVDVQVGAGPSPALPNAGGKRAEFG